MKRFALLLAAGLALAVHAEDDVSQGLSVGFGKASIGGEICFDALLISQELGDRRWLATLSTHGTGECREQPVRANMGIGILRMTPLGHWAIGLGAGVWEHGDRAVGPKTTSGARPQLCAHIGIRRYLFHERAVLDLLHCSTGGSSEYNPGRNLLTLSARF